MIFDLKNVSVPAFMQPIKSHSNRALNRKKLIVVGSSGKGGTGKTTVSVNLALFYSSLGHSVVLCDFDTPYGDVAAMLDVSDNRNITAWKDVPDEVPSNYIENLLMDTDAGIKVLPSIQKVDEEKIVNNEVMAKKIINNLREYDIVIIDAAPKFDFLTEEAFKQATDILFVSDPNIISLNNIYRGVQHLQEKRIDTKKITLVVNKVQQRLGKSDEMYRKLTQIDNVYELPFENKMQAWQNAGLLAVLDKKKSALSRTLIELADDIFPTINKKRGLFKWN